MPVTFTYEVGGAEAVITVPDALADYYRGQPSHTEVITEEAAVQLKGDDLDEAAKAAGVPHPSRLKADEKRAAIVDATAPTSEEN